MKPITFHGDDYVESRDKPRLGAQLQRVYDVMQDGKWRSHEEIITALSRGGRPREKGASIARQVRYLKDIKGCTVHRRHDGNGLYRYRLEIESEQQGLGL